MADNNKTTFVLSDESVNSYNKIILTSGIDTAQFEANPIMLYMHKRSEVIGRWENIRKDGGKLLADAVFDDTTELAAQVKAQVEKGFLRAASICAEVLETGDLNGVQTIVKCRLTEASIVDIPSNSNALKLRLSAGDHIYFNNSGCDLKADLIGILGLSGEASDMEIIIAVKKALKGAETFEKEVDEAISCGYITPEQREECRLLAECGREAFTAFMDMQRKIQTAEIDILLQEAIKEHKILHCERGVFEQIGAKMGSKGLKAVLFSIRPMAKPLEFIEMSNTPRDRWTLNDYRKFAPKELEDNPELYARLVKEETGADVTPHTLDWYRKNDPEYLRKNPDIYRKLIEQEQNKNN